MLPSKTCERGFKLLLKDVDGEIAKCEREIDLKYLTQMKNTLEVAITQCEEWINEINVKHKKYLYLGHYMSDHNIGKHRGNIKQAQIRQTLKHEKKREMY